MGTQTPATALADADRTETVTVEAVAGDALAGSEWPAPDVLKIDVEGAEEAVLAGLADTLGDIRAVFVEAHGADEAERLAAWLEIRGFDVDELHRYDRERYLEASRA